MLLTACGPASSGGSADSGKFTYLGQTENTTIIGTLTSLSTDQCAAEEKAAPLTADKSAGPQFDQKLQLLAGQDALNQLLSELDGFETWSSICLKALFA